MSELLRVYEADEIRADGYPVAWAEGEPSIKDLARQQSGHRCVRCEHPYRNGEHGNGEWSRCDERCSHGAPVRCLVHGMGTITVDEDEPESTALVHQLHSQGPVYARWRILTVHHLTGDKADCRWWNLAALCQRCHLQIQGRVNMAQVYPHEHSEWFRPYAAGYYASVYLGEDLPRFEAVQREDELLALERLPAEQMIQESHRR